MTKRCPHPSKCWKSSEKDREESRWLKYRILNGAKGWTWNMLGTEKKGQCSQLTSVREGFQRRITKKSKGVAVVWGWREESASGLGEGTGCWDHGVFRWLE